MVMRISMLMLISSLCFANYPVFNIVEPWEFVKPKELPPSIEMTFVKKVGEMMPMSVTFAREKTRRNAKDYIDFIRKMYEKEQSFELHDLGKLGPSFLLQIQSPKAKFGPMKIWQAIQVVDSVAYVLTVSGPEKSFERNKKEVQKILQSFQILKNPKEILSLEEQKALNSLIQDLKNCQNFKNGGFSGKEFQENELLTFKKQLIKEFAKPGPIWQLQLIAYLSTHLNDE